MSLVTVAPESVGQAAGELASIRSALTEATAAAAAPTTGVLAPAADEISAAITALFGSHAQEFQALSAQAATFHDQFVGLLNAGAGAYVSSELANAAAVTGGAATSSPIDEIITGAQAWIDRPLRQAQRLAFALYRSINGGYQFALP
jgi:PE family